MAERKTEEDKRLELHDLLIALLGSQHVYFQPPDNLKMEYPCILYYKSRPRLLKADDRNYLIRQGYTVTVVDYDPDSQIPYDLVENLKFTTIDSTYRSNGLNHTKLTLYY